MGHGERTNCTASAAGSSATGGTTLADGPERIKPMRWYGEWTRAREPYRGSDQRAIPPGFECRDADEASDRYVGYLDAIFHLGRLGLPWPPMRLPHGESNEKPDSQSLLGVAELGVLEQ